MVKMTTYKELSLDIDEALQDTLKEHGVYEVTFKSTLMGELDEMIVKIDFTPSEVELKGE